MTTTQEGWLTILGQKDWRERFKAVEGITRPLLLGVEPNLAMTTLELLQELWPQESVRGPDGIAGRKYLQKILGSLARHAMKDCTSKDYEAEPVVMYGKSVRPWRWHWSVSNVQKREPCPHCQGKGYTTA